MFGKKCPNCRKKVAKDFEFCPYCGYTLKERDGLLDTIDEEASPLTGDIESIAKELGKSMGFDFIDKFPFDQIVRKMSRDIEKQFKDVDREIANMKKTKKAKEDVVRKDGAEITKTTFPGGFSVQIQIGGLPSPSVMREKPVQQKFLKETALSEKEQEKISRLPRKEPETRVRRLTNKIVYEIDLPGVTNVKDVIINRLENSIEVKAFAKDKAYFKLIPLSLPIERYHLKEGKLVLELKPED
jgi:RNA polymerase subunit RPABC4/transcription elongation factor Spt4